MDSNITHDAALWLQTVSSYEQDKNITSEIKNAHLAAGFVLDIEQPCIINGNVYPINYYQVETPSAAEDLIAYMADNGFKIYLHALVKSTTKDLKPNDIIQLDEYRKIFGDSSSNEEQKLFAQQAYDEYYGKLPDVELAVFTAVIP